MKTLDLIESKDMDKEPLKKYYKNVINFFKKYKIDIKKYMMLHRDHNPDGHIDILIIDLDSMMEDEIYNYEFDILTLGTSERERTIELKDVLEKQFIKKEEKNHETYTMLYGTLPREEVVYCSSYVGPQVKRKNFDKPYLPGIEGQWQDGNIVSYADYVIEIVVNRLIYQGKINMNLSVGCFLWNLMEKETINHLVANSVMFPFFKCGYDNDELRYGIPKDFITSMLRGYGVRKKIDFSSFPGVKNKPYLLEKAKIK